MYFEDYGGVLIEARDLVNGVTVIQAETVERVEYFHIELDTHDVVLAEGAPSETFMDDDNRAMFHNADEYHALYRENVAPAAARYCAPRLDDGYEVEEVRRRIASRAATSDRGSKSLGVPPVLECATAEASPSIPRMQLREQAVEACADIAPIR